MGEDQGGGDRGRGVTVLHPDLPPQGEKEPKSVAKV